MNRMNTSAAAKRTPPTQPPLTVKMGDKQWVVGSGSVEETTSPSMKSIHLEELGPDHRARLSESTRSEPLWRDKLEASLAQSMEELLDTEEPRFRETVNLSRAGAKRNATGFVPAKRRRRWKETFQLGCILGLVLGCLSMVMFHQMAPDMESVARAGGSDVVVQNTSAPAFVVPAVKVQILQTEPFSSMAKAEEQAKLLRQHSVGTVLHQSHAKYVLWVDAAVQAGHLKDEVDRLKTIGVKTAPVPVELHVESVPALAGANPASLEKVSHWMSSSVSALVALTAVQSDGGVPQDAATAYQSAKSLQPTEEVLAESGKGSVLMNFAHALDAAYQAYQKHQTSAAHEYAVQAYELLAEAHA